MQFKKIAIVYDWIDKWGGIERVLLTLHEIFPDADFVTSYYDPKSASWAKDLNLKTSFIQKLPNFIKKNRIFSLPFYPYAFESMDFKDYDLVISVSSSFAKSIITRPETKHICYLLTPTRYLWVCPENYINNSFNRVLSKPLIDKLKKWDYIAARRPDKIISISKIVADRCRQYYGLESDVVYPPFDIEYWIEIKKRLFSHPDQSRAQSKGRGGISSIRKGFLDSAQNDKNSFFLVVSRLEPYKKIDLAIKTFNKLPDKNLIIIGKGSQSGKLKKMARKNISFIEYVTDEELAEYYSQAEALIMPQEEDFGYVAVEAQYFDCPVVAYGKGGAEETILEEKTGIFFDKQTEEDLIKALARFEKVKYNLKKMTQEFGQKNVERFDKNLFKMSL